MHTLSQTAPRIYVASLSDYNSGRLHGKWIDASQTAREIHEEIRMMLTKSKEPNAEEWAIHDFEGFCFWKPCESESLETISRVAELIGEYGEVITALVEDYGADEAETYYEENYQGEFESLEDWAYLMIEECGWLNNVHEQLKNYIDYMSYGEDCRLNGDIFLVETGYKKIHVFWNN